MFSEFLEFTVQKAPGNSQISGKPNDYGDDSGDDYYGEMNDYDDEKDDPEFNSALKNANDDFGFDVGAFGGDDENFNDEGRNPHEN